jgi:hypothetical protein
MRCFGSDQTTRDMESATTFGFHPFGFRIKGVGTTLIVMDILTGGSTGLLLLRLLRRLGWRFLGFSFLFHEVNFLLLFSGRIKCRH